MIMKLVKPSSVPEKLTHSTMDTIELTPKLVASWKSPPFQRDLKINSKVMAVAEEIKQAGGVLPGILTLGVFDSQVYVVDGQHRIAAWQQTSMDIGYADVRTHWFSSLGEMAKEFVKLNSSLVRLRPDDILRGLEASTPALQKIRRKCGFVGYDMVRRSERAPVLSMSVFLRSWMGSRHEAPQHTTGQEALNGMTEQETDAAINFVTLCYEAWSRDFEYRRLWSMLNFQLCAWLYRRLVLGEHISKASRVARYSKEDFRRCLMALSTDPTYLDYLIGRNMNDRDRAPAYSRIKALFQKRYFQETGKKGQLPIPEWSHAR